MVDGFTFFNELDLLEIRLKYLYNVVDYFIIVEADQTFNGKNKDFILKENFHRFKDFQDKIIYLPIHMPHFKITKRVAWEREKFQRNQIKIGLEKLNMQPNDFILISDIDEIPNKQILEKVKDGKSIGEKKIGDKLRKVIPYAINTIIMRGDKRRKYLTRLKLLYYSITKKYNTPITFNMSLFYYYINHKKINGFWPGMVCFEANLLKEFNFEDIRTFRKISPNSIENAGWHFSYLGGIEMIKYKLQNFSHQESNIPEIVNDSHIDSCMKNGFSLFEYNKNKPSIVIFEKYDIENFPADFKKIIYSYDTLIF